MIRHAISLSAMLLLTACAGVPRGAPSTAAVAQMREYPQRLILVTVANPPVAIPSAGATLSGFSVVPGYVVGDRAREIVDALQSDYTLRPIAAWPIAPLRLDCVVFLLPPHADAGVLLARLARDPRVRDAQPLQTFRTLGAGYNDPYIGLQQGFWQIHAAEAQQWSRGQGVKVAIVDTGIDTRHPDLRGRILARRNFVDGNMRRFESDWHGTEIAGVIAADANNRLGIVGIAPAVRVLALKACWQLPPPSEAGQCNSFTLAQALTVAIESGVRVINLSLGGPPDPLLSQLVGAAIRRGIVVVGAVPPDGRLNGFPSGVPGVIAVDVAGHHVAVHNGSVHLLFAPGHQILTLTPGGHYDFASGSSLSCAHVTGVVALLLARQPKLDADTVYALLKRSSLFAAVGYAETINAGAALAAVVGVPPTQAILSTPSTTP